MHALPEMLTINQLCLHTLPEVPHCCRWTCLVRRVACMFADAQPGKSRGCHAWADSWPWSPLFWAAIRSRPATHIYACMPYSGQRAIIACLGLSANLILLVGFCPECALQLCTSRWIMHFCISGTSHWHPQDVICCACRRRRRCRVVVQCWQRPGASSATAVMGRPALSSWHSRTCGQTTLASRLYSPPSCAICWGQNAVRHMKETETSSRWSRTLKANGCAPLCPALRCHA